MFPRNHQQKEKFIYFIEFPNWARQQTPNRVRHLLQEEEKLRLE